MDDPKAVIEIPVEEPSAKAEKVEISELKDAGFNEKEMAALEKHKLVAKEGGDKNEETIKAEEKKKAEAELLKKSEAEKAEAAKKAADEKAAKDKADKEAGGDKRPEGQELSNLLVQLDKIEDEKKVHEILDKMGIKNTKDHNFFLEARRDRRKRQSAQAERDHAMIQLKAERQRREQLEAELEAARKGGDKKEDDDGFIIDEVTGEKKEKPLTKSDIEKMEAEKAEAAEKEFEKRRERAREVTQAVTRQEDEAKERYEDFNVVLDHTTEILQNINNLEKIFPGDPRTQRKVRTLARQAFQLAGVADQVPDGEQNAADLSYEIGTLHPKYKPGASGQDTDKGGNGGEDGGEANAEKVKKALEEANKSRSSAGLNGGPAKRAVSVQDLTLKDVEKLPYAEFARLRKEHPKVIEKLLREKSAA